MVTTNEFLVAVGANRQSFDGRAETFAKTFRIEAMDAVAAGEVGLNRLVHGAAFLFTSASARVVSLPAGTTVASLEMPYPKAFGVARRSSSDLWQVSSDHSEHLLV